MVIEKFPGANLIGQFLKQVTKPLSKFIVRHVKKRPFIRKYVLIKLGHLYFWYEDKVALQRIPALAKKKRADDIRTMELGAKLLIEVIIITIMKPARVTHAHRYNLTISNFFLEVKLGFLIKSIF